MHIAGAETGIDDLVLNVRGPYGKDHAPESPIGDEEAFIDRPRFWGQEISERTLRKNIEPNPTKTTFEKAVTFFQRDGAAALRAWVFDLQGCALEPFAALVAENRLV